MGEVYRALDTKLNREVALKVLPDHLLDPDRLARFRREAQVVASLNHPNIAAIYGLEDSARPALVLELVEGPTLADRIAQGPLPVEEAVAIARQIADALEAAHEQGVVHRDLKPANIKLRPDGAVKVLDFGLAKLTESGAVRTSGDATLSPTLTAMTGVGIILGTAAYMAPEQASGKQADKRADIWAFGVVLWEMLTGDRLFGSTESTSHVLADVLRAPIDFEKIPAGPLRDLLRRCLDRDVKTRLRDIGEARVVLSRPLVSPVLREKTPVTRHVPIAWAALAVLLAASTGVALWAPWRTEPERPLVRLYVDLGADVALPATTLGRNVFLSPDGSRLMYMASVAGGSTRLYVRRFEDDNDKTIELPGTDGVAAAAFSPDGRSVAFVVGTRVYRISVDGGAALRLAEIELPTNQITWGDGDIIIVGGIRLGLFRLGSRPGPMTPLTTLAGTEAIHASPEVLPGGKTVLFIAGGPTDVTTIEAVPASGGTRTVIVPNGLSPRYIPTGHLLYLLKDTLFAVRFDPDTLQTSGDPVPIVADVKTTYSGQVAVGGFSVAQNGTLVYRRTTGAPEPAAGIQSAMIVQSIAGDKRTPLVSAPGAYFDLQLSPDGAQIAMSTLGLRGTDIAVFDPRRDSAPRKISFDGVSVGPVFIGKDGRYVVSLNLGNVTGAVGGGPGGERGLRVPGGLRWRRVDGGDPQPVLPDTRVVATGSFSVAAGRLAFVAAAAGPDGGQQGRRNIFTVSVTEEADQLKFGQPERFSPEQFTEYDPQYSPDGRWIAFVSDRSAGREEVYVRAAAVPKSGVRYERQISTEGGNNPRWSRNSAELLYQSGQQIIAVPFTVRGETLEPEKPTVRVKELGSTRWALAPDGRIIAIVPVSKPADTKAAPPEHTIVLLQNFFDEVRRKVKP
jgi:serine/threonine-protein kinase